LGDDLPSVLEEFRNYELGITNGEDVLSEEFMASNPSVLVVPKDKIAANGDFNFSGERYREAEALQGNFPQVELGSLCKPEYGFTASAADTGNARFIRITDINSNGFLKNTDQKFIDISPDSKQYLLKKGDLLVARTGATFGKTVLFCEDYPAIFASYLIRLNFPPEKLLPEFYWAFSQSEKYWEQAKNLVSGGGQPQFNGNALTQIKIPLPPIAIQQEIVAEIEGYQKVIDGARAVIDNYRPHIPIDPDWDLLTFVEAPFDIIDGDRGVNYPKKEDFSSDGYCVFLNTKNVRSDGFNFDDVEFVSKEKDESLRKGKLSRGDVLLTTRGTIGNTGYYDNSVPFDHIRINSGMLIFRPDQNKLSGNYLFHFFQSKNFKDQRDAIVSGAAQPQLPIRNLIDVRLPVPPLETQKAIVAEIEVEQSLVDANRELITRFEKKIQTTLNRIWGEEQKPSLEPDTNLQLTLL
jgi:restriction endonuclease S subunit